jgi:hypothetical protein
MGYVPSVESRLKLYDGIEIDLNNTTWAGTGSGCSTVLRSQKIFNQGKGLQELISTFSDQGLNLLRRLANRTESGIDELHSSRYSDLYNRVSILGVDMSDAVISDVKEILLMVNTEPAKVRAVYESKTFSLELMFMHAMKKNVITNRNGVFTLERYC